MGSFQGIKLLCAIALVLSRGLGQPSVELRVSSCYEEESECSNFQTGAPVHVVAKPVSNGCTPVQTCSETLPPSSLFQADGCSFMTDMYSDLLDVHLPTLFQQSPYIVVASFNPGQGCSVTELSDMVVFLADGRCHMTGEPASYVAIRNADGSMEVQMFSDTTCDVPRPKLMVTAFQALGNSCANGPSGILDKQVFGRGATQPLYLASTVTYESASDCEMSISPTVVVTNFKEGCQPSACRGWSTRVICSTLSTYSTEIASAFGTNSYVVVKTYAIRKSCATSALTSAIVYLADGKCHKNIMGSVKTTIELDGAIEIDNYNSEDCTGSPTSLAVTAAQVTGNSCTDGDYGVDNTKFYVHSSA